MDAYPLLRELDARGITAWTVGDRLRLAPPEAVDDQLRARVERTKPLLLAALLGRAHRACYCCFGTRYWTRPALLGTWRCGRCHHPVEGLGDVVWSTIATERRATS